MSRKQPKFIEVLVGPPPGWPTVIADVFAERNRLRDLVEKVIEPLGGQVDGAGIDISSGVGDFTCSGAAIEPIFVAAFGAIEHSSPPAGTTLTAYLAHGRKLVKKW
jgi:hypothetical protein